MCRALPTALLLTLALIWTPVPSDAVEVRQGEGLAHYHADLVRAYAACTAPNDVTRSGVAACNPPVTSACVLSRATVDIETPIASEPEFTLPRLRLDLKIGSGTMPAACHTGDYFLDVAVRTTAEARGIPGIEAPCTSGQCTHEDRVVRVLASSTAALDVGFLDLARANTEILGITLIAPDGLPVAAAGTAATDPNGIVSNLTVPYPVCTAPESAGACSLVPWSAPCDYELGTIAWHQDGPTQPPVVRPSLRNVTGSSPLCASGTYVVEATVRATNTGCGSAFATELCTLVDQTVTLPVTGNGHHLDDAVATNLGPRNGEATLEILAMRILDPTGAPIGSPGVTGVRSLVKPRITIEPDEIRLQVTIPLEPGDVVDPTLEEGLTVTVTDRTGPVYAVTIPSVRWQAQPPIGSRWDYKDKGGVLNGVRTARFKRIGKDGLAYRLDLRAVGIDLTAAEFPGVTVGVDVGRPDFDQPHHAQGNRTCRITGTKLTCK